MLADQLSRASTRDEIDGVTDLLSGFTTMAINGQAAA